MSNTIVCECGQTITKKNLSKHVKTQKHLNAILQHTSFTNNASQQKFINSDIQNAILMGSAGCGKTRTIIEFCIHKFNNKLIKTYNDFMIITFSNKACSDFIIRGKQSSNPLLFNEKNIKTIHSFALNISNNLFKNEQKSVNTVVLATLENLKSVCITNDILKFVKCLTTCKFIFIDEAQDISVNQYNFAKYICNTLNIPLILVGDPNQNIYQFQGGTDKYLFNKNIANFELIENYRSTISLVNFANQMRPYDEIIPKMTAMTNEIGEKPIIFHGSIIKILQDIRKELSKNDFPLEEIAIIGPVKLSKDNKSIGLNSILAEFSDETNGKKKIPFVEHYADGNDNSSPKKFNPKKGHVNLLTIHGSKGLEFKKVLVINFHFLTYGFQPTEIKYTEYKYLWYVALSRAEKQMKIYIDCDRFIFPAFKNISVDSYTVVGNTPYVANNNFAEERVQTKFLITKILNDHKYFNENTLYDFTTKFKHDIQKVKLYDIDNSNIIEKETFGLLYGMFIETLFKYYYYKNKNNILDFITQLKNRLVTSAIYVDVKNKMVITSLKQKGIICEDGAMHVDLVNFNALTIKEREFIKYCQMNVISTTIYVYLKQNSFEYDLNHITALIDSISNNDKVEKTIFDIELYFYQIEHERASYLNYDFSEHIKTLSSYFKCIDDLTKTCDNFKFHKPLQHPDINLFGIADVICENKIIELKFSSNFCEKFIIQTLLYYNNKFPYWTNNIDIEIWNLFDGYKYIVNFDMSQITASKLNNFLCNDVFHVNLLNQSSDETEYDSVE